MQPYSIGICSSISAEMLCKIRSILVEFCLREKKRRNSANVITLHFNTFTMKHLDFHFEMTCFHFKILYYKTNLKSKSKQNLLIFVKAICQVT